MHYYLLTFSYYKDLSRNPFPIFVFTQILRYKNLFLGVLMSQMKYKVAAGRRVNSNADWLLIIDSHRNTEGFCLCGGDSPVIDGLWL